jgi:serine protease
MNPLFPNALLTGCLSGVVALTSMPWVTLAQEAQAQTLAYDFYGRSIPLTIRQDVVAVDLKDTGNRRGGAALPYLQLRQALQGGTRGDASLNVDVQPLGKQYAVVSVPTGSRSSAADIKQRVERLPYVQGTLPVLSRSDRKETIVVPNEMVLSFATRDGETDEAVLKRYGLEVLRELPFSNNQVVVRSPKASGLDVLNIARQLSRTPGVRSATPNFVQSVQYTIDGQLLRPATLAESPDPAADLQQLQQSAKAQYQTKLTPLQWHLDSRPKRGVALPRTDVRAPEAWQLAQNDGKGVVVAVIDSLIQWDHPDLEANLYQVGQANNLLPGEKNGWDFAGNDPDTRISADEIKAVEPYFQDMFRLSDAQILERFSGLADEIGYYYPDLSKAEIATFIRNYLRSAIAAEFHGTWSAGVIAAHSKNDQGIMGIAPNAKILPVRVFGLGGAISLESLVSSVRYSAARGADIINLSLGGSLPTPALVETFFEVMDENPKLVIVASAGNSNIDGAGFPAAIPGVVSVGATNLAGERTFYSNYGGQLVVTAPGGDTSQLKSGGILTTGGTFADAFWQGIEKPKNAWGDSLDPLGQYVQVQGTSFSGPAVAGVVALMKGEDPQRRLNREQLVTMLKNTSSHQSLQISPTDQASYRLQRELGFGTAGDFPFIRPSGVFEPPTNVRSPQKYYFGHGLVNAEAAVQEVLRSR